MRDPSRQFRYALRVMFPRHRGTLAAILAREGAVCCPVVDLPGGRKQAEAFVRAELGVIWEECPDGPSVTLNPWTADQLDLVMAERVRVRYRQETYRDDAGKKVAVTMREIEEWPEWREPADVPRVRVPRATGFVPLPEAHRVAIEPEPKPESGLVGKVAMFGRVFEALRPRKRSKKRKARKARPV